MDRRSFVGGLSAAGSCVLASGALATPDNGAMSRPSRAAPKPSASMHLMRAQGDLPLLMARIHDEPRPGANAADLRRFRLLTLAPERRVRFCGWAYADAMHLEDARIDVDALFATPSGDVHRHALWEHRPEVEGGSCPSVSFSAREGAFTGFHIRVTGTDGSQREGAFVAGRQAGQRSWLPGVYVLAGTRRSTGQLPSAEALRFSGDAAAPVAGIGAGDRPDFPYLTVIVRGAWV